MRHQSPINSIDKHELRGATYEEGEQKNMTHSIITVRNMHMVCLINHKERLTVSFIPGKGPCI